MTKAQELFKIARDNKESKFDYTPIKAAGVGAAGMGLLYLARRNAMKNSVGKSSTWAGKSHAGTKQSGTGTKKSGTGSKPSKEDMLSAVVSRAMETKANKYIDERLKNSAKVGELQGAVDFLKGQPSKEAKTLRGDVEIDLGNAIRKRNSVPLLEQITDEKEKSAIYQSLHKRFGQDALEKDVFISIFNERKSVGKKNMKAVLDKMISDNSSHKAQAQAMLGNGRIKWEKQ